MNKLWHYTTVQKFRKILESGEIIPSTEGIFEDEKPVVWFSFHEYFEPTAAKVGVDIKTNKTHIMSIAEMIQHAGGLIRIEIDPSLAPLSWKEAKDAANIKYKIATFIYEHALMVGSSMSHWRGSLNSIPSKSWLSVEMMKEEGKWVPMDMSVDDIPPVAQTEAVLEPRVDPIVEVTPTE